MEYISAEEFLKQPKNVQKAFLNWINGNVEEYDLVQNGKDVMLYKDYLKREGEARCEDSYPLLTEGQLRKFIEDKTDCNFEVNFSEDVKPGEYKRCISMYSNKNDLCIGTYQDLPVDLLQTYWKVAIEIAKESDNK